MENRGTAGSCSDGSCLGEKILALLSLVSSGANSLDRNLQGKEQVGFVIGFLVIRCFIFSNVSWLHEEYLIPGSLTCAQTLLQKADLLAEGVDAIELLEGVGQ